ncbi:2Fe-2S iron-sulfur cluster-binding protein [Streptomyces pinistramenti]|uniref:2Fe-2S iron-sulfur cluster-binding protein n=1 Tax=Streptomyces pinistramenti TaxID=2884812 RepID=UPI001D071F05|nr:2Fe-2S iron-sulfur cluster-binding protein [Streptomyces pinistramenti]MCB5911023.1 (2Fe-2S)-binding protein [Streptomyces pinistramenti]
MSDDNRRQQPEQGWQPLPQGGEYEQEATAFVQLPEGFTTGALGGTGAPGDYYAPGADPLAAPGHGYVPPASFTPPIPGAGTDPSATGQWTMPFAGPSAGYADPSAGYPAQDAAHQGPSAGHPANAPGDDRQWGGDRVDWPVAGSAEAAGTGSWSVPAAPDDVLDESGEYLVGNDGLTAHPGHPGQGGHQGGYGDPGQGYARSGDTYGQGISYGASGDTYGGQAGGYGHSGDTYGGAHGLYGNAPGTPQGTGQDTVHDGGAAHDAGHGTGAGHGAGHGPDVGTGQPDHRHFPIGQPPAGGHAPDGTDLPAAPEPAGHPMAQDPLFGGIADEAYAPGGGLPGQDGTHRADAPYGTGPAVPEAPAGGATGHWSLPADALAQWPPAADAAPRHDTPDAPDHGPADGTEGGAPVGGSPWTVPAPRDEQPDAAGRFTADTARETGYGTYPAYEAAPYEGPHPGTATPAPGMTPEALDGPDAPQAGPTGTATEQEQDREQEHADAVPETHAIPETHAVPETHATPETHAVPEAAVAPEADAPEGDAVGGTFASAQPPVHGGPEDAAGAAIAAAGAAVAADAGPADTATGPSAPAAPEAVAAPAAPGGDLHAAPESEPTTANGPAVPVEPHGPAAEHGDPSDPAALATDPAPGTPESTPHSDPENAPQDSPQGAPEGTPQVVPHYDPDLAGGSDAYAEEHPHASYVLRVNGADRPVTDAWIGESLLYVLRERLGLAGAKDGCSQGECGACSVQVDGRLVASCLVPAATTAGCEVRTVEGLAQNGAPSDVQRALAASGAVQCGFCVPGMAMTVHDLLEGNHAPSELETRKALCGNLCRCSGYRGVLDAVDAVVQARAQVSEAAAAPQAPADTARIPHQAGPADPEGRAPHDPAAYENEHTGHHPGDPHGPHHQGPGADPQTGGPA